MRAKQLLAIINDLPTWHASSPDRLTLEPLDFDPQQVLQEVVRDVSSAATVKGLVLKLDAPDLPPLLRGDPVRLGQILGNFASNAVKFTERGRIEICAVRLPGAGASNCASRCATAAPASPKAIVRDSSSPSNNSIHHRRASMAVPGPGLASVAASPK